MPFLGEIGELLYISRAKNDLSFEWRIREDVLSLTGGSDGCYSSPDFSIGTERWWLSLWPNWEREEMNPASGRLMLGLMRGHDGWMPRNVHFSVGIVGSRGVIEMGKEGEKEFQSGDCCRWDDFCSRSHLMKHRTRLMVDGTLTIMCAIKNPGNATDVSSRAPFENDSEIGEHVPPENSRNQSLNRLDISSHVHSRNDSGIQEHVPPNDGNQSSNRPGQQASDECVICCGKSIDCAFNPCGHMSCCYECALQVEQKNKQCPVCRQAIHNVLKLYKSV